MKVAIRVDSSKEIGAGHVMRCLTLADGMAAKGASVGFFCANLPGNLGARIAERGYSLTWVEGASEADKGGRLDVKSGAFDLLIVDHYGIDKTWESRQRPFARKIFVIDDLADRSHDCDALLDQNFVNEVERYQSRVPKGAKVLEGPRFAMIRREFLPFRVASVREHMSSIFLTFGGGDARGICLSAAKLLCANVRADIKVVAADAGSGELRDAWAQLAIAHPNLRYVGFSNEMPKLLSDADLYIGAGGSISWERCYVGVPALIYSVADNQVPTCKALHQHRLQTYLGSIERMTRSSLKHEVAKFSDAPTRDAMRQLSQSLVDGQGVDRVVDVALNLISG